MPKESRALGTPASGPSYSLQALHPEFAIVSGMIKPGFITKIWDAIHRPPRQLVPLIL